MSRALDQLLERLATVPDVADAITLEGHLLRGPQGCIRFVTGGLCLDVEADDVLAIEERGGSDRYAIPVRIVVRRGLAVHGIGSSEPFKGLIGEGRVPFAVRTRKPITRNNAGDRRKEFHLEERRFLEKYGLVPASGNP